MRSPLLAALLLMVLIAGVSAQEKSGEDPAGTQPRSAYLGFDRNDYPGDANLPALRTTFAFTSYWLNNPPGATGNTWKGKRQILASAGFGFLVVFNGKVYAQLKSHDAAAMGRQDAALAVQAARTEGFRKGTVIFLDQEEGGRLLPEQKSYLYAWVDAVNASAFRAGVYCSGIPFHESRRVVIVTAQDIRNNAGGRNIVYWVTGDGCPPSPGCGFFHAPPKPAASGVDFAEVWQFAQSPRRAKYTAACRQTYSGDGNCYPPGLAGQGIHVDVDSARSADPSGGNQR